MPNMLGAIPSPYDENDYTVAKLCAPVAVPRKVSMRNELYGIFNQGECGTCVGKASNGVMSAKFKQKLSSLYIYTKCKEIDGLPGIEGTIPRIANKVMQKYGSCPDRILPYSVLQKCNILPKITREMDSFASIFKINRYARAYTLNEIKRALAKGDFVKAVIAVGPEFMNYKSGVLAPYNSVTYGYHEVLFCGYDDDLQAIEGANSWGKYWGEDGCFWLSYDIIGTQMFVEAWEIEVLSPDGEDNMEENCEGGGDEDMLVAPWKEKEFWVILIGALLTILNDVMGLPVSPEVVWPIILLILGWVFKNGAVEVAVKVAAIKAMGSRAVELFMK